MSTFAIIFKESAVLKDLLLIDADYYEINNGFFRFYKEIDEIAAHSADEISSCTVQNKYTEEEVLEALNKCGEIIGKTLIDNKWNK